MELCASHIHLLGLCRVAGRVGSDAHEEVVRRGGVAMCVEVPLPVEEDANDGGDNEDYHDDVIILHAPISIPDSIPEGATPTVVVIHACLPVLHRDNHCFLREFEWGCCSRVVVDHLHITHMSARFYDDPYFTSNMDPKGVSITFGTTTTATTTHCDPTTVSTRGAEDHRLRDVSWFNSASRLQEVHIPPDAADFILSIGHYHLSQCPNLRQLDILPFRNVVHIGNSFVSQCSALVGTLDLSALSALKSIGGNFACGTNFTEVILPHSGIIDIGSAFLSSCKMMTTIDLVPLSSLTNIPDGFLGYCRALTSIDLAPLKSVTHIGVQFMHCCGGLSSLDTSPMVAVKAIGFNFAHSCTSLQNVNLGCYRSLKAIPDNLGFRWGVRVVSGLELSPLANATSIGSNFIADCPLLTTIDLSSLSNVTKIGERFITSCPLLASIDLSPLTKLLSIGYGFFNSCPLLIALDLSTFPLTKYSTSNLFLRCTGLKQVTVSKSHCPEVALARVTRSAITVVMTK